MITNLDTGLIPVQKAGTNSSLLNIPLKLEVGLAYTIEYVAKGWQVEIGSRCFIT
jgi:hypothetical protein